MRYARDEPALGGSRTSRGSRSPWGHADGPGRMAPRQGPRRARQPHAGAPASPSARVEPRREHLAVLARQLVVEPRVRLLRRHRRPLLLCVEPPYRPALDHHVHRPPGLGQCMMISAGWYTTMERRSKGLGVPAIRVVATWAYRAVDASSACPSRTWIIRMSVPLSRRCVAKLCRSVWAVTGLLILACRLAARQAACKAPVLTGVPGSWPGTATER